MLCLSDRVRFYPDYIVRMICGGEAARPTLSQRIWSFVSGGVQFDLADDDYEALQYLTNKVRQEFVKGFGLSASFSMNDILKIRAYAACCVETELLSEVVRVLFIVDDSLGSLRRFTIPARAVTHQSRGKVLVDCAREVDFLHALGYDIIVVRQISPRDYVLLSRLQFAGKIVVFDIDELLFNIPSHHPKALTFTPLDVELHHSLLRTADFRAIRHSDKKWVDVGLGGIVAAADGDGWVVLEDMVEMGRILPSPPTHSPDRFDIVCFADEGQQADVDIIDDVVMECLCKMPTAHVTFVGCAPMRLMEMREVVLNSCGTSTDLSAQCRADISRVHVIPFPTPSDYYALLSHIPMDLALVPRLTNDYNAWGSDVPMMELLAKGVPVLANEMGGSAIFDTTLVQSMQCGEDWEAAILSAYSATQDLTQNSDRLAEIRARYDLASRGLDWARAFTNMVTKKGRGH